VEPRAVTAVFYDLQMAGLYSKCYPSHRRGFRPPCTRAVVDGWFVDICLHVHPPHIKDIYTTSNSWTLPPIF